MKPTAQPSEDEAVPFGRMEMHRRHLPSIAVGTANEPRPTNGRPQTWRYKLAGRAIPRANIKK